MANIGDVMMRFLAEFDEKQVVKAAESAADTAAKPFGTKLKAGIGQAFTDFGNSASKIGKGMTKVGDSMNRNVTLPILAAGGATAKLALDFDTTMNQIVGLAKVPRDQIDGVRQEILDMAGDVGKSPQELAEAFYFVASAGFEANEAMDVLATSAKASAAGMGDTQDIAQVLGSVINAYGHENITAAEAADTLTAAVQDGTAEASDFAGVLGRVVPAAAAMKVPFSDVTAALSGMTLTGLSAEEAATGLNQVFVSLLKPTKQAEDALEGMGLSAADLREELRTKGLLATLRTLQERFGDNEEASAKVFGNVRALRTVTSLLALDEDQLNGVFADTTNALGTLQTAYDETEGPQRDIARSMADLQATAINIGEDVLPIVVEVLHDLAGGAKEFAEWWDSLSDQTRRNIVQWVAWLAVAGPALSIIGRITTGIGGLSKALGFLIGKLPLVGTAAKSALGPLGTLLIALEGLRFGINALTDSELDREDAFKKAAESTGDFNKAVLTAGEAAQRASEKTGISMTEFRDAVVTAMNDMNLSFDDAVKYVEQNAYRLTEAWEGEEKRTTEVMAHNASERRDIARMEAAKIPKVTADAIKDGAPAVGDAMGELTEEEQKALKDAHDAAVAEVKSMLDDITALFAHPKDLREAIKNFHKMINHPWADTKRRGAIEAALASDAIAKGLRSKDSLVQKQTIDFINSLLEQYDAMAPGAFERGKLINPELLKGIKSNIDEAYKTAEKLAERTGQKLDFKEWASEEGYDGILAFIAGMEDRREAAREEARAVARGAAEATAEADNLWKDRGFTAGRTYADGIYGADAAAARAADHLEAAGRPSANYFDGGLAAALSWARGLESRTAIQAAAHAGAVLADTVGGYLEGASPPPKGPLHHIDTGAENIVKAWTAAALAMRDHVARSWSQLADAAMGGLALSPSVALPTPGLAGLVSPTLPAVAAATSAAAAIPVMHQSGDTIINVPIQGLLRAEGAEDVARPLRMLAESGVLPPRTRYTTSGSR